MGQGHTKPKPAGAIGGGKRLPPAATGRARGRVCVRIASPASFAREKRDPAEKSTDGMEARTLEGKTDVGAGSEVDLGEREEANVSQLYQTKKRRGGERRHGGSAAGSNSQSRCRRWCPGGTFRGQRGGQRTAGLRG